MAATRMRDTAFKQVSNTMPLGSAVKIEGPSGSLTLNEVSRTAVFLAGGSDIKPFRSIVFRAAKEKLSPRIFLFYSTGGRRTLRFSMNFRLPLEKENPNYKLIATMTEMAKLHRSWNGETGLIDKEMRPRYLKDAVSPIY
jgi:Na+-transporting NADH:ubiquinone oxidoreductase subunit NqrF